MLALAVLAGAKHISHFAILRNDNALRTLFKWNKFPDDTTFGRIFSFIFCKEL